MPTHAARELAAVLSPPPGKAAPPHRAQLAIAGWVAERHREQLRNRTGIVRRVPAAAVRIPPSP